MQIVANRRTEASNPRFVEDVRRRKLCIAEGKGVVHGISYDLEKQYGLSLRKADLPGCRDLPVSDRQAAFAYRESSTTKGEESWE